MNLFFIKKNKDQNAIDAVKYAMRSEIESQNGKYKSALNLLKKAVKLDNKNDSFYYLASVSLFKNGDFKKALQEINTAIKLNSKIYYYYLHRADIFSLLNNINEENENIKQAYNLMSKPYKFYKYKKEIYEAQGNKKMADFCEKRYKKLLPENIG